MPLPSAPALDVRNPAVFHKDVFMLANLYTRDGKVLELSDQRFKTQVGPLRAGGKQGAMSYWQLPGEGRGAPSMEPRRRLTISRC